MRAGRAPPNAARPPGQGEVKLKVGDRSGDFEKLDLEDQVHSGERVVGVQRDHVL